MREQHPIDDFFKHELSGIPAEPPARLRAAILAGAQRGYKRTLWRKRSRMTLALLLLLLSPAGYWFVNNGAGRVEQGSGVSAVDLANDVGLRAPKTSGAETSVIHLEEGVHPSTADVPDTHVRSGPGAEGPRPRNFSGGQEARTLPTTVPVGDEGVATQLGVVHEEPLSSPNELGTAAEVNNGGLALTPGVPVVAIETEDAFRLMGNHVGLEPAVIAGEVHRAMIPETYVLPHGDWWLASHLCAYAAKHNWEGTSTRLADALNKAESLSPSAALGIMVGRRWRSGLGAGLGVEVEQTEQAYRHLEHNIVQEHTVIANMVTLNTTVIAMVYDTLSNNVVREYDAQGLDQRTTVRVPLEAYWHVGLRRWVLGVRVGTMAEINRVRSTSSLVQADEDGHIYSTALSAEVVAARYPTCVTGLIGADLGFALHERWTLLATPHYARGFVPGAQGALQATPERLGIRFQLCHYL